MKEFGFIFVNGSVVVEVFKFLLYVPPIMHLTLYKSKKSWPKISSLGWTSHPAKVNLCKNDAYCNNFAAKSLATPYQDYSAYYTQHLLWFLYVKCKL